MGWLELRPSSILSIEIPRFCNRSIQDRSGYIEYSEFENLLNQLVKESSRTLADWRQGSCIQVPANCEFPPGRVKQQMPEFRGQSYNPND